MRRGWIFTFLAPIGSLLPQARIVSLSRALQTRATQSPARLSKVANYLAVAGGWSVGLADAMFAGAFGVAFE